MERSIVAVFADPNPLSVNLIETLLANFCRVKIISEDKRGWKASTRHLRKNESLDFLGDKALSFDYAVFISACFNKKLGEVESRKEKGRVSTTISLAKENKAKCLLVFPYIQSPCSNTSLVFVKEVLRKKENELGIIYVGELFGPRMFLDGRDGVAQALGDFILKKQVSFTEEAIYLFPTYIPNVSKALVKSLFSFGNIGEEVVLCSEKISSKNFSGLFKKINPQITLIRQSGSLIKRYETDKQISLSTNLERAIKETLNWFTKYKPEELKVSPELKQREVKQRKSKVSLPRWGWVAVTAFLIFILSPFFFLLLGASSFYVGAKLARSGNLKIAEKSMVFSKNTSSLVYKTGIVFTSLNQTALVLEDASSVSLRAIRVAELSRQFVGNILTDTAYDPLVYSKKIALELDVLYKDSGFLQSEIGEGEGFLARNLMKVFNNLGLSELRDKLLLAKRVVEEMPEILGAEEKKEYLVLFQNNMELRPTGGFIGSFALLTFDKGKLSDVRVQDVYSADGQLKGHVEPPEAIKDYLGEANWFLRDSNWDPDFPTSATRAEWFLEKEIDQSVDGVVGIDLILARELLKEVGPIYLSDFEQELNSQNLYEITQHEVEKDFFPGSYKKTNFLTALARELLNQLMETGSSNYLALSKVFYKSLEEKHIQVFLHNREAQRAISSLGWEGAVYQPKCSDNCFADWLGMVEANVGVNKANYFIERNANLSVRFEDGLVKKQLTIFLKNKANPALGAPGRYKTYLRILAPQAARFQDIEIISAGNRDILIPEINEISGRKEAGVVVEVGPGQTKSVTFSWENRFSPDFNLSGEYRLFWRKQAGTDTDPIIVKYFFPEGISVAGSPSFSLTQEAVVGYNTNLARDFTSRVFW